MPRERFRHLFIDSPTQVRDFGSPRRGGSLPRLRSQDRQSHAQHVSQRLQEAWVDAEHRQAVAHSDRDGIYLEFSSEPGFDLVLKGLEARQSRIVLQNVRVVGQEADQTTKATVFVPRSKRGHFLRKISAYAAQDNRRVDTDTGEVITTPKNAKLVNSIADVRAAVLESFWLGDTLTTFPPIRRTGLRPGSVVKT